MMEFLIHNKQDTFHGNLKLLPLMKVYLIFYTWKIDFSWIS